MPYRTILNMAQGAVNTVSEFYEDVTETVRSITPEPINQALDVFAEKFEEGFAKTPIGVAERGAAATGELIAEKTGNQALGQAVGFGLGLAVPGPEISRAATPIIPKGVRVPKPKPEPVDVISPTGMVPAMAGGAPMPPLSVTPSFERGGLVMKSTTSPEWTSPKAGLGSAASEQFAPAVETFKRRRGIYAEVKDDLKAAYEKGEVSPERLKKALAKIGKHEKGVMSTLPYDEANPEAYLTDLRVSPAYRQERAGQRGVLSKLEEEFGRVDPYDVTKPAQQHHVLAKAETKPFVDTLLKLIDNGVGNDDDLVNFFVWPEKYELYPGNVIKNLLDMGEVTHTVAQKDPMALHKILDMAGLEFGGRTKARIIKDYGLDKVTNVDELMQAYDRYLQEIAVPSRDIAYKVQDWWYNKTIKTLKGKELKDFKQRFAALQDPRKPN